MAKPAWADTMQAEMHLRFLKDTPTWKHKFNAKHTIHRFSVLGNQKTTRDLTAFQNAALKNVARCQLGVQLALTNACLPAFGAVGEGRQSMQMRASSKRPSG